MSPLVVILLFTVLQKSFSILLLFPENKICLPHIEFMGHDVAHFVEALRYKTEGRRFDPFRPHYGLGVNSASNRNEYQEYYYAPKAAGT
jgi:hypothetical protein